MTLTPAMARARKQIEPSRPARATLHTTDNAAFARVVKALQVVLREEGLEEAAAAAWTQADLSRSEFDYARLSSGARQAIIADAQTIVDVLAQPSPELAAPQKQAASLGEQLAAPREQR